MRSWLLRPGKQDLDKFPIPMAEYEYVLVAREFGFTPQEWDDVPAHVAVAMLPILEVVKSVEAEIAEQQQRNA